MAEFLGVVELGGLYKDGVIQPRSTKPWWSDSYPSNLVNRGNGNILNFNTLPDINKWIIGDTPSNLNNKLTWVKIKDEKKIIYICDRCILALSWYILSNTGYVEGKEITIDGKKYICRLLSGEKSTSNNEWDRFIVNEDNINGLPIPTTSDKDTILDYTDLDGEHNQFWNWWGVYSWCKEFNTINNCSTVRGCNSSNFFMQISKDSPTQSYPLGWRPVLETLNIEKYLIQDKSNILYTLDNNNLIKSPSQTLDENNFNNNGFNDIAVITKNLLLSKFKNLNDIKLLVYTDDLKKNKCEMIYKCIPNDPKDKLKLIDDGKFDILMKEV